MVELDTRLAYACMAKNSMINVSWFSPYQVVFGKNLKVRSNLTSKKEALGIEPSLSSISKYSTALQDSPVAFLKADNDQRVKRALRHSVRA